MKNTERLTSQRNEIRMDSIFFRKQKLLIHLKKTFLPEVKEFLTIRTEKGQV